MIVISRRKNESIVIGDDIEVKVVDILEDLVKLGVETPIDVPVHRKEVYDAIKRENRAAASVKPEDIAKVAGAPADGSGVDKKR